MISKERFDELVTRAIAYAKQAESNLALEATFTFPHLLSHLIENEHIDAKAGDKDKDE